MFLSADPAAIAAASAQVGALTARLGAAAAAAAPAQVIVPPAADPISLKTAVGFTGHAVAHHVMGGHNCVEFARSAEGLAESGASYARGDALSAAALLG
jgi:hypothetical protein